MDYFKKNITFIIIILICLSCYHSTKNDKKNTFHAKIAPTAVIVDCNYSFDEAVRGSKAPTEVLKQLELFTVRYYSFDNKLHQGQVLCNKKISHDIKNIFELIKESRFPVGKVIPAVRYNWEDEKSMEDDNSYSFCYRDVSYSKHAEGMAIDINPYQNPVRWSENYKKIRKDRPFGASYNPQIPGTFTPHHPIVIRFEKLGFKWGRNFHRNDDDHHFEK